MSITVSWLGSLRIFVIPESVFWPFRPDSTDTFCPVMGDMIEKHKYTRVKQGDRNIK